MTRIDAVWLVSALVNTCVGTDRLLASVLQVFSAALARRGCLLVIARSLRIKPLVHNGFGVWCAARRRRVGRFQRSRAASTDPMALSRHQFDALVLGLPWQRLEQMQRISHVKPCQSSRRAIGTCPDVRSLCGAHNGSKMLDLNTRDPKMLRAMGPAAAEVLARLLPRLWTPAGACAPSHQPAAPPFITAGCLATCVFKFHCLLLFRHP